MVFNAPIRENCALRTLHDIQDEGGLSNDLKFYILHSPFAFRVAGPGWLLVQRPRRPSSRLRGKCTFVA